MILLQANRIQKSFGIQQVLSEASMVINEHERVGMVGANGCGKSTFLKCLAGSVTPDSGDVILAVHTTAGCLDQMADIPEGFTAWDAIMSGFPELMEQRSSLRELEIQMTVPGIVLEPLMARYARLTEDYERNNGYACESMARKVLAGLGFNSSQFQQTWSSFSGGEKTRLNLARLLVMRRDILLLDEPTNHLDISSVEWLEDFLQSFAGSVLVVSHDRRFLDRVARRIVCLSEGKISSYPGNYSRYVELKAAEDLARLRAYERQQSHIQKTEEYILRYKAGIKSKQARGRKSQLDRMERLERPDGNGSISVQTTRPASYSGHIVIAADSINKSYNGRAILADAEITINKGERLALVGPNGCGKSTLLGILAGRIEPDSGSVRLGSRVRLGFFDQENQNLNLNGTVLEEIVNNSDLNLEQARTRLGSMLFTGDDVFKRICDLSGGEKARLSLLKLLLLQGNMLIMDEPTNHLDIESRQAVEAALTQYPGTILLVSHDRYFVDQLADTILAIEEGRLVRYPGKYSDYQDKKAAARLRNTAAEAVFSNKPRRTRGGISEEEKNRRRTRREQAARIEQLESSITGLETRQEMLEQTLSQPETYQDQQLARDASLELKQVRDALLDTLNEWEYAMSELEEAE